jgi:uracil-DNA glycosylase family 4
MYTEIIKSCTLCALSKTRRTIIIGYGCCLPCNILFIGEGPNKVDDLIGHLIFSQESKLLDEMIIKSGLNYCTKYFTNIVLCHPTDSFGGKQRNPTKQEILTCTNNIKLIYKQYKPKIIITIGELPERYYKKFFSSSKTFCIQSLKFLLETGGKASPHYLKNIRILEEAKEYLNEC